MKNLCINLKKEIDLSYPIIIQRGILKNIENLLDNRRYFLITNDKIAKIYGEIVNKFDKDNRIIIKDGEKYKNLKTVEFILSKLLDKKIERKDCIIAFGGGVIGDMAGFCASCVLRGVDFIQIPTTLLSQVDSSVGGKTGFNDTHGKNLIGAFYQPKKVFIDPDVLDTLDEINFKSGMGEVIKYAFIEKSCGAKEFFNLFSLFEKTRPDEIKEKIEDIIFACVNLKAAVVEQDEKEKGLRAILNLGHTYAHAIEKISNYKIPHGQAVCIGIKMALRASYIRASSPQSSKSTYTGRNQTHPEHAPQESEHRNCCILGQAASTRLHTFYFRSVPLPAETWCYGGKAAQPQIHPQAL